MPLKIAIDLDCTVLNTTERLVEYINERVPVNLKIEDITSYSIEAALPEQYQWIVDSGFRDKEMWRGVQVLPYAADVIKKLYDEGHEIFFATSSLPENLRKKINHLSRNLHFFPKDYVWQHTINTQCKQIIKLDVLVDDGLFNLLGDREYVSICVDMPYNQTSEYIPNFYRAYNWDDIYCKIKMIESLIKENDDDVTP